MFNKILKFFGLIRICNVDEYWLELTPDSDWKEKFDSSKYDELLRKMRGIHEFKEYCDWTAIQDTKRFYNATTEEQPMIRGAVSRTRHFRSLCLEAAEKKMPIQRYQ